MNEKYAAYPSALVYEDVEGRPGRKVVENLLWGDALDLRSGTHGDYVKVRVRTGESSKRIYGWMKRDSIQDEALLEVTFTDIGQGDGCVVFTPDRRVLVIDAGERDNMMRFLKWRLMYPSKRRPRHLEAAIITHPDKDHYFGFKKIFAMPHLTFENVYHNGLVERKGDSSLGPISGEDPKVYTDLVKTERRLKTVLKADEQRPGRKMYPDLLRAAMENKKFNKFRMLSRSDGHVPGFGPDDDLRIEVLGPIVETNELGKAGLRRLGATGITKNGHSVVLRLVLGNLRVLLGGDLNVPSEELLLKTVVGREIPTAKAARAKFLREARELLEVDVAKSCHHGSADFSALFLDAVNPIATVISSGDAEPHSHPRAETLGAIGVSSRGDRPLIYSTELARSVKESIRNPAEERRRIMELSDAMAAESDRTKRAKRRKALKKYVDKTINRTVQTYGAIYLRSDGERAVIGHKYESNSPRKMWDINTLEPDADGRLHFHSHHH